MKVMNRSTGVAGYSLPELNIRRVFNIGEIKELKEEEILALYNTEAGRGMLRNILQVQNKEYVLENIYPDAPIEYFWTPEEIKKCILEDDIELFIETLDYAPEGMKDIIKDFAWRTPLTDLNKCTALKDKLNFDVLMATKIMGAKPVKVDNTSKERIRKN